MNYLINILSPEEIEQIYDTFNINVINKLSEDNIKRIIIYLKNNNITIIKDMLIEYLDLFIIDIKDFIIKFEKLKSTYPNINNILENDLSILEKLNE